MWRNLWRSSTQDPDLASSVIELMQSMTRNLVLATGGFALLWHFGVAELWSDEVLMSSLPVTLVILLSSALSLSAIGKRLMLAQTLWLGGLAVAITLALYTSGLREIAFFYAFLPLLATITLDWAGGLLTEGIVAALAWAIGRGLLPTSWSVSYWAIVVVGGALGALVGWVITHTLLTVAQWSLFQYQQNRKRMDEARDQRFEFKQTQEDLTLANRELARLSDRLKVMYRLAEEARRAKEEFVANVSHELRTPLNMIIGFSEMITRSPQVYGAELPTALLADISAIQRNSEHLARLVDDVLDLSQAESGRTTLSKEWTSLPDVVGEAALAVHALFESKGLYLEAETTADLPTVFCDSTRIRQVVINLLSNAGRFTKRGGVRIKVWQEGQEVLVSVTDTGPGIAPEDHSRLFEPFQQLDSSVRRQQGGSGLGLSISKRFVEMHGGRMWLQSPAIPDHEATSQRPDNGSGPGTTFYFSLPLDTPLPPALASDEAARWFSPYLEYDQRTRRSRAAAPALVPRLVVVEPQDTLQQLFGRYVDDIEIASARSFDEAVRELSRSPAQALIVNAPSLEEASLAADQLADLPYGTPMMTCWVPGEDETARRLGVVRYLVKPVSRDDLLSALSDLGNEVRSVLLVDDEPEVLQLFGRMLSSGPDDYRVLRARNGQRALALLRERQPDVMLLDLIMPGMDGFQVLQAKRHDPSIREIPVVVVSSRDPSGEPIVSDKLTVTRSGGLSMRELLACIRSVSQVLAPSAQPDRAPPESAAG